MKKGISLLLALLMVVGLAACGETASSSDPASTGSAVSTGGTAAAGDETSTGGTASTGESSAPSAASGAVMVTAKGEPGTSYEAVWDSTKGTLELAILTEAEEEMLASADIPSPLVLKQTILYEVTATAGADGTQVLKGEATGVKASVTGAGADAYIQLAKDMLGDSDSTQDKLTLRLLEGETLTGEEMEPVIYEIDSAVELTLQGSGEDAALVSFTRTYTEFGSQLAIKNVYTVEDGVVRVLENYVGGVLETRKNYRETGVIEKITHFSEGKESDVVEFDENGEAIEQAPSANEPVTLPLD